MAAISRCQRIYESESSFVFLITFRLVCDNLATCISSPSVCDQSGKNPLKYSATAESCTRATRGQIVRYIFVSV